VQRVDAARPLERRRALFEKDSILY